MSALLCWIWPYLMGGLIGWLAAGWLARQALATRPATVEKPVDRVVEKPVDRVVEKVVTKTVDNPSHLAQIATLTATAALVPSLRSQITALEAAPAKVVEKIVERGAVSVPAVAIDLAAARAAGFSISGPDDLAVVEGIGPKIAELLNQAGVHRFSQLAQMTPAQIQPILDAGGSHFKMAVPDTWPEQALLAANNHWRALKSLQDVLIAGVRK